MAGVLLEFSKRVTFCELDVLVTFLYSHNSL